MPHHIVLRGNNRRRLFSYPRDYLAFIGLLEKHLHRTGARLAALTLMTNHGHMVATPPALPSLADLMRGTLQPYAQKRNRERQSSGKLFEQRFRSFPIRSDGQLARTIAYVGLNPERARVCAAADYQWTTYRLHAGGSEPVLGRLWTPSPWYLGLGSSPWERSAAYLRWIEHERGADGGPASADLEDPVVAGAPRILRPDGSRAT